MVKTYELGLTHMSEVVIKALRVDPDSRVFDLKAEPRLGAFEVAGQDRTDGFGDLTGGWIDLLDRQTELHAFDANIAKP